MQGSTWKLTESDSARIMCDEPDCQNHAQHGRTINGGAPFFYECETHLPELSKIRQDSESLPSYFLRGYDCEHKRLSPDGDCLDCGS